MTKERESSSETNMGAPANSKPQPVAVEIPVTVNGACAIGGSDKREPFSEATQTVLVFASGAVIRLAANVGPGQLLFVTNEKSKKEVVCQVVKSKQNGSAGRYVELKFTEPAVDFWGVRLPGAAPLPLPVSPGPVPALSPITLPTKTLEQKLTELNSAPLTALPLASAKPVEVAAVPELPQPSAQTPTPQSSAPKLAPVVTLPTPRISHLPGEPPASTKVPTLSEFLTQGANGLELSVDKPNAPKLLPEGHASAAETKIETKATKPAAPSPLGMPSAAPPDSVRGLTAALGIGQNPAPGTLTFDLAAEEVKIPAWLEPLARNSATQTQDQKPSETKSLETKFVETRSAEALDYVDAPVTGPSPEADAADSQNGAVFSISNEGRAPNFGSSLPLGGAEAEESSGSGKGWKIALVIVALLLGAAALWFWYVNQPLKVSASGNREAADMANESAPTAAPSASVEASAASSPAEVNPIASKTTEQPVSTPPALTAATASRPAANPARTTQIEQPAEISSASPAATAKKPALGKVHLAAPVVGRRSATQEDGAADPGLALSGVSGGDPNNLGLLAGKGKEPTAPVPIGGEVKPARLLSSVPPVYPQLARTQRLSGDVTLDALIDVNGRVSATKVISGPALLHQSAIDAVKQWKYQPAALNGQPTSMHLTVTVQFRLQ